MEEYIHLRYQYRIYTNSIQRRQDSITDNCCRFVRNYYLNYRNLAWRTQHKSVNYNDCAGDLKYIKMVYPWLNEADSVALQEELKDLQRSFENFWTGNTKYPKFRFKKQSGHSYRTRNNNHTIRIEGNRIHLPKLGWVRIKLSRPVLGKIENATIIKKPSGKYFVSLTVKIKASDIIETNKGYEHGLDLGLHSFYTLDNGVKISAVNAFRKYEDKLARAQRRLSRMRKESSNYRKQKLRVARIHEKIANIRHDFLHKESTELARKCSLLCVEDLHIRGMVKNHHLAKSISDASWSEFIRMLEYKLPLHGGALVKVSQFYASSQTCHICGHRNPKTKDLSVRGWICPECETSHDRDVNAAINILNRGKAMLPQSA